MSETAYSENALARFCSFLISSKIFGYKGDYKFKKTFILPSSKIEHLANINLHKSMIGQAHN